MSLILLLLACRGDDPVESDVPDFVPWSGELAPIGEETTGPRGYRPLRAIVHLHSPISHDACDNGDGADNPACLQDLRDALCRTRVDAAFLTDHPAHAAGRDYEALLSPQPGDELVTDATGAPYANRVTCDDGHVVTWYPGIEDELMPLALDRHVADDAATNDAIYNGYDAATVAAERDAGAAVWLAHGEGRDRADLEALHDAGLVGLELFNLHAAFDPENRELLGLDPYGWIGDIVPFTDTAGTAEPDLLVLAVLSEQAPSVAHWDALLQRGPIAGAAGTDAHQNAMPTVLRDGERGDSYRRMLRWFSNVLLADGDDAGAAEAALRAGRVYVAFEVLGTPSGFDVYVQSGDATYEMGADAPAGTLVVACPTLSASSPRGEAAPEITTTVLRDGVPWQTGCGSFAVDGPAVYRVRADIVPRHLEPFLGGDPEPWMKAYPWVYSNAIRVGF